MTCSASRISVIVPAHAADESLRRCLSSLQRLAPGPEEVILVDDGGEGKCAEMARGCGFRACETSGRRGPAVARNVGAAHARGDVLLFIDADVLAPHGLVGRMAEQFAQAPGCAAIIGSYDASPADAGFFSQYKNLVHRYVHQTSSEDAFTFWGACGAVRRQAFEAVGGFDQRYARPSIEDIELGYRLRRAGYRIRLDRKSEVTHLKRWTARSLVVTEIADRAIPWTRLIVQSGRLPNDLNLRTSSRAAAALACLLPLSVIGALAFRDLWPLPLGLLVALLVLDAALWRYLASAGGVAFMIKSMAWHWFYYIYSTVTFVTVGLAEWISLALRRPRGSAVP